MRMAFTMIELVFIIVILGILAVVAIPKFAATREDAKVSATAHGIMTTAFEISTYAMAQGQVETDLKEMSNMAASMEKSKQARLSDNTAEYDFGDNKPCVTLAIDDPDADTVIMDISFAASPDASCKKLQLLLDQGKFPMTLRGNTVVY